MQFPVMTIGQDDAAPTKRNRHARKSRAFQCLLLRAVVWTTYRSDKRWMRPVFLDFCGTESQHRAFMANLRCGRVATLGSGSRDEGFELLRSEEYRYSPPVRCDAGIRQVVYFPSLFDVDVKGQSERVQVVAMPPRSMLAGVSDAEVLAARSVLRRLNDGVEAQRQQVAAENAVLDSWRRRELPGLLELDDAALREWAVVARELLVRVDSRTRFPIPTAPEYRAGLLAELLRLGVATLPEGHALAKLAGRERSYSYRQGLLVRGATDYRTVEDAGYLLPVALDVKQEDFGTVLAATAKDYFAKGGK